MNYAIILEDDILYCSNNNKYNTFEIIIFVEKLLRSINPQYKWRLSDICLEGFNSQKECMVIKHVLTENNENLFYCITGDFETKIPQAQKILNEFYEKVETTYHSIDHLKQASRNPMFKEIVELTSHYVKVKHEKILKAPEINTLNKSINNKIIYCGISNQGLPIISKLYDQNILIDLDKEINTETIDLFTSNLSANLATIAMNSIIRAKTRIKEIHISDLHDETIKRIIFYGGIDGYSLDFIATGSPDRLKRLFRLLENKISKESILRKEFSGDLKPYKYLGTILDEIILKEVL